MGRVRAGWFRVMIEVWIRIKGNMAMISTKIPTLTLPTYHDPTLDPDSIPNSSSNTDLILESLTLFPTRTQFNREANLSLTLTLCLHLNHKPLTTRRKTELPQIR